MSDKRQRARVQGSWAKQLPKGQTGVIPNSQAGGTNTASGSWGFGNQKTSETFKFHQPTKPVGNVPPEKVIEQAGDYEISQGPSGVSQDVTEEFMVNDQVSKDPTDPPKGGGGSGFLHLQPGFITTEEADWMFSKLLVELPWSQKTNYRQGEAYDEPRLTCWYGELPYTYARSTMPANSQWPPLLVTLHEAVEQASGCTFNSLLCNLYRDGHDSIGWHSDDEASLGPKPTIASLSLGDTRVFSLRKQPPPEDNGDYTYVERIRVPLSHGTLLLMKGATQDDWQHQVAKEYHDRGPRINLTFRTIHPEPDSHRPGTKIRFTAKQL